LRKLEHGQGKRAKIIAELAGSGMTADAFHLYGTSILKV
jgi:3-oxoacyl-(acyl-carrier-protein) synthase